MPGLPKSPKLDWRSLVLVIAAPLLFFGAMELLLAVFGVEPVRFERDPYVGFSSYQPLFVRTAEQTDVPTRSTVSCTLSS